MHQILKSSLVCPLCKGELEFKSDILVCQSADCGRTFDIAEGIPIMTPTGKAPEDGDQGFYPAIKGGTMEDNPNTKFTDYDSKIRTHYLRKYLPQRANNGLILDICCSKAPFYYIYQERGYEDHVIGLDLLLHQLKIAQDRGIKVINGNALHLPFPDCYFSTVVFTDALVHLIQRDDQMGVLKEIHRVLRPGGQLIMTAPGLRYVGWLIFRQGVNIMANNPHCTYFSEDDLKELFGDRFELVRDDKFAFYPYLIGITRLPGLAVLTDRFLNRIPMFKKYGKVGFYNLRKR